VSGTTAAANAMVQHERDAIGSATDVLAARLVDVFMATCDANGGKPALVVKEGDGFTTLTWAEYRALRAFVAMGLAGLGVGRGDFVALMLTNRPEHVIADVGTLLAGATPVSVYNTLTAEQVGYIAGNCDAKVAIVEDAKLPRAVASGRRRPAALEHIDRRGCERVDTSDPRVSTWADLLAAGQRALEDAAGDLENAGARSRPDDAVTLIYTSGTTGPPKGVIITHQNLLYMLELVKDLLDMQPGQRGISYLPLAHVAERMTTHYNGINIGGTVYFVRDVAEVLETLQEARPQMFMAVPRVWEKMQAALLAKIDADHARDQAGPSGDRGGTAAPRPGWPAGPLAGLRACNCRSGTSWCSPRSGTASGVGTAVRHLRRGPISRTC
jgi:long-chain acyl-CoA synthetase